MKIPKLIAKYEQAVTEIVKQFIVKQCNPEPDEKPEDYIEYWIGEIGSCVMIADRALKFIDILHDMKTNQPKGQLFEWYDFYVENQSLIKDVSYQMYCKSNIILKDFLNSMELEIK